MKKSKYISIAESLLFVSGEALKLKDIAAILEINLKETVEILEQLEKSYEEEKRGIKLVKMNNEYQLVTKQENSDYVEKLLNVNVRHSLSQAALETLAIITYRQPITRIEIDEIRGVKSDRAVQTLQEKNLIKEYGRKDVPGRPILYVTTDEFLKHFGIESLKSIPLLEDISKEYKEKEEQQVLE